MEFGFMQRINKYPVHIFLIATAFIIALIFRMIRLGLLPLNDMEAEIALQAFKAVRSSGNFSSPHTAYLGFTGISFYLLVASNFLARFWPALFGALIVFFPFLIREYIGEWPATVLSLMVAIAPELVGLSRVIGSPMVALTFLLLAIGLIFVRKPILAGIALALGLMGGQSFWIGSVILAVSYALSFRVFKLLRPLSLPNLLERRMEYLSSVVSFFVTLFVVGTGFFLNTSGLSGIFSGLFDFITGWASTRSAPLIHLPLALIVYSVPAVFLGIWGGVRGFLLKNKIDLFLLVCAGFGFLFLIIYPGAVTADLVWVTLPLWALSARVLFFAWHLPETSMLITAVTAILVIVLSAFILFMLRSLVGTAAQQQMETLIAITGAVVLFVAIVLLVSYGWNEEVAISGFLIGLVTVFCLVMISVSVNSTGLGPEMTAELWCGDQALLQPEWIMVTADRIVVWNASSGQPVDISVSGVNTPGMQWVWRDYAHVDFESYPAIQSQPGILITGIREMPELSFSYRGQALVWARQVLWEEMTSYQYLQWVLTRDVPINTTSIIFWARTDLLPDSQFSQ